MSNLSVSTKKEMLRVPDERVLAMIASCAEQIARVSTIADACAVTDVAEAIAAVARKIKLSKEVKASAIRIMIAAESKLGEITAAIPRGATGKGARPACPRKIDVLAANGVTRTRSNTAERLSQMPQKKIEAVIASGAKTMHGVLKGLDLHADTYDLRAKRASALAFLCEEAVSLLDRSVKGNKVPHAGTVAEMVHRHTTLTQHGNLKDAWGRNSQ